MDNLISRQAVIQMLNTADRYVADSLKLCDTNKTFPQNEVFIVDDMYDGLEQLPSAQTDIIRCKDCKWWDKSEDSSFGYCMAMKHGYMSANWEIGIYRRYKGDFYCADAERRTDEAD